MAFVPQVQAVPSITVNGSVSAEIAPPAGLFKTDTESGAPLARNAVSVADELTGVWQYAAVADGAASKLAILGVLDNTAGGALSGPFGGEVPSMRVNASLTDTINIIAPSNAPYLVTAKLDIDGVLQVSGSDGVVKALMRRRRA